MTATPGGAIAVTEIFDLLPHRYPFLLVDRVLEYEPGVSITAIKNVTVNEPFFQGHFPGLPVMPGMLILEALAQAGGLLVSKSLEGPLGDRIFMFTGVEKAKFRRPVTPGDQLVLRCFDLKRRMTLCRMHVEATVDGKIAAEAELSAAVVDKSAL
ncbi:beta-hydroxyacyl-(acyl-carrier-protein) dehydratase FabZ [Solidesulfovibrio fructosivorans JJ]]|uniref:3-hydroxyacyl-[acyl-carrier-protein] dehydratase FabZ n=1 Tax=Solidesulfovibrio fructosivorans JJ] TaxID=596151 RepID=E1K021_SOLFR|nr:3-hydroxyacyl-ACP dehydratase FabZ [Solidesulfovibrio fructosivorans]EFL50027.1 beta-hydroxyacyl-(acyl-carrier-protein) dehydratase FabZ [Solidesulfovibrio fructosivorans JJ]]